MNDEQRRMAAFRAQPLGTGYFPPCCVMPRWCATSTSRSPCLAESKKMTSSLRPRLVLTGPAPTVS